MSRKQEWWRRLVVWLRLKPPIWITDDDVRMWRSLNPGRCMYCSYTRWANTEQGQNLKLEPHNCPEGNSPPQSPEPLPVARAVR